MTNGTTVRDPYAPVRGKCTWWREVPNDTDAHDIMIKTPDKKVDCTCFVEGNVWSFSATGVPSECPEHRHCRYYIKGA